LTEIEFEKIIDRYSRLLWTIASRILSGVGSVQDVEECVSDVFIDMWKDPQSYDPSRGTLKTFLCVKCRSKAINRFRSLSSRRLEELDDSMASEMLEPGQEMARKEDLKALKEALDRLDDTDREILLRRFTMQQKPSQIAKAMSLPLRKVENIIYRAKRRLRDELEGQL